MPNGIGDDAPVTWGRFTATTDALGARVADLEATAERQVQLHQDNAADLAQAEEQRRTLERRVDGMEQSTAGRRQRTWTLVTILISGVALPILVSLILVALHLRR